MEKKDHFRDPKVLKELIQNLVGPIMPTGCDSEDRNRLENLKIYGELIDSMVIDLDNIVFSMHSNKISSTTTHSFKYILYLFWTFACTHNIIQSTH